MTYRANQIQRVIDAGPDDLGVFRLDVSGDRGCHTLNVSVAELTAIRDLLAQNDATEDDHA